MDPDKEQSALDPRISEVCNLLWGSNVANDIFQRWSQGFFFSADEPTALVQTAGGPCAVIAPMQAFILKYVTGLSHMKRIEQEDIPTILVKAATDMLKQTSRASETYYLFRRTKLPHMINKRASGGGGSEEVVESAFDSMTFIKFHENIEIVRLTSLDEVIAEYANDINSYLTCSFGVLLFLYSVMLTRGLDELRNDLSDPADSLIESTFGYGSQSLINLMLTGRAVSHVWDHDQDVAGLKLKGLEKQSSIGFLTLLEHHQLCEVGSFFKNPEYPIWILASDTHLTVVFSFDKCLVGKETQWDEARRVFRNFDREGNDFIQLKDLAPLLQALDLVCEDEYVELMGKRLDSEELGIILMKDFIGEFFEEEPISTTDMFTLWHYNGLSKSSRDGKVQYHRGQAVLLESVVRGVMESNSMLTVLQTKWPSIDVQWDGNSTPSLN